MLNSVKTSMDFSERFSNGKRTNQIKHTRKAFEDTDGDVIGSTKDKENEMKAVTYVRVSSTEQEQGYSPASQAKLLTNYAAEKNYEIVREFREAETAKKAGRENFSRMVQYLKDHPDVQAILCEKTDRLSRNFTDMATLEDLIDNKGCTLIFVKENNVISKNSNSQGKLMFYIMASMAKNYINNLSEETRKGLTEKAEQGIYPSSAPLGYINCSAKHDGEKRKYIAVDETRATVIQKIFRLYATGGYSLKMIAKTAYEEGLRTRGGARVGVATLHKTLHNSFYYGCFTWGGKLYEGSHPPLVSKELFNAVQEAFDGTNRPKMTKKQFAYSGLMVCGKCGCAITAEIQKGKYVYYHCTGFKGKCQDRFVREEELTQQFAEVVKKIHIDDNTLSAVKKALLDSHADELEYHQKQILTLTTQKTKLENRQHQIYVDKLDGKVSEEFYANTTEKWQEELSGIKSAIAKHENADNNYLAQGSHILELCNKAYAIYLRQTPLENGKLLRYILSNCTLTDATVCATYRNPFSLLAKGVSYQKWGG